MLETGVDVVDIARFDRLLKTWPRLEARLFTKGERLYACARRDPAQHLAVRFAAKEATFKALGSGWPYVGWHEVEVVSDGKRPKILLVGKARDLAGDARLSVSLSHDGGIALAQVAMERPEPAVVRPEPAPVRANGHV